MKKTVSFNFDQSTIDSFENEGRKYPGSKSAWAEAILKPSLRCISEVGFDRFIKIVTSKKQIPDNEMA